MSTTSSSLTVPSSGGVAVALHDLGGTGEPLLVCHATGFHGRMYAPLARSLTTRFNVFALDFRGHGASTMPGDGDMAWAGMADDLLACVDAIGVRSLHAFGHSMGGAAILLAELRRPGTIASAFLYEPIVFERNFVITREQNPMSGPARRRREVFASRHEALSRFAAKPPLNVLRADALSAYIEHGLVDLPDGTVRLACRAETEASTFEAEDKMTLDLVENLMTPIVVAGGEQSGAPIEPIMLAAPLVKALGNATLIEYESLGHFGPFQDPDRIAADILAAFE